MKKKPIDIKLIKRAAKTLKVIAHPCRLRIVELLVEGEKSVTDLICSVKSCQVSISKHLAVLKKEGVVSSRSEGSFRFYSVKNLNVINILGCIRKSDKKCGG